MKVQKWVKDNRGRLLITLLMGLLPLVLCVLYCALYGKALWELFLPGSYWNDELFYYKQVEGMLYRGVPAGYFGFNESQGRFLSFAAWSPFLLLAWCLWGLLFGWGFLSPILCNLVCMMAGMAGFAWLARPGKRQAAAVAILFSLFTPLTRYTLSGMPDSSCWLLLLLYLGLVFRIREEERDGSLIAMFVLSGLLTLMRPYFLLLMLYPAYFYGRRSKRRLAAAVLIPVVTFAVYGAVKYCLGAAYLHDLFDVSFLTKFWQEGMGAGFANLWELTREGARVILKDYLPRALKYGHFAGSLYALYGLMGLLMVILAVLEWRNRKKAGNYLGLSLYMIVTMTAMMGAVLFMYKTGEGSRHLESFILMGIVVLGMYLPLNGIWLQAAAALAAGYFFIGKAGTPYDYQIPMDEGGLKMQVKELREGLEQRMEPIEGIAWDNTVIWLSYDYVDGEAVTEKWQLLYGIPEGFGINFCSQDYVMENFWELKSRYMAVIPGGDVEKRLLEAGAVLLGGNEEIAVYLRTQTPDEGFLTESADGLAN